MGAGLRLGSGPTDRDSGRAFQAEAPQGSQHPASAERGGFPVGGSLGNQEQLLGISQEFCKPWESLVARPWGVDFKPLATWNKFQYLNRTWHDQGRWLPSVKVQLACVRKGFGGRSRAQSTANVVD